ncbi:hypothetical protein K440DRAFT_620027 [Wilcoxina mikolae CBS 423.85]|nr:hypothetical protein K440DRAFT_620027 [Wilcoxina mikolae CBS 423.85]
MPDLFTKDLPDVVWPSDSAAILAIFPESRDPRFSGSPDSPLPHSQALSASPVGKLGTNGNTT